MQKGLGCRWFLTRESAFQSVEVVQVIKAENWFSNSVRVKFAIMRTALLRMQYCSPGGEMANRKSLLIMPLIKFCREFLDLS